MWSVQPALVRWVTIIRGHRRGMIFSAPENFQPHALLRGPHRQTVFSFFVAPQIPYRARIHHIELPDGDRIVLHDDCPASWPEDGRIVILVHGLAGCHASPYLVRVTDRLIRQGIRSMRMDMRGCGAGAHLATGVFHADRASDLLVVCQALAERFPRAPMTLCGFSLGANLILKMLGKFARETPARVDSAIAVQPPIDLSHCCRRLHDGWGWIYDLYFTRQLWRDFCQRRTRLRYADRVRAERNPGTLLKFDEQITAPLAGFSNASEYYTTASAQDVLPEIRVPTIVVAADDDPIVRPEIYDVAKWSSFTQPFMVAGGGHLGFVAGNGRRAPFEYWLDAQIESWIQQAAERI